MINKSDTPRTDEQALIDSVSYDGYSDDYASLLNFARELERELNELKARHKTAILECTKYTPESWAAACEHEEPCAVWLDGPQMTQIMKDAARFEWLLSDNMRHHRMCIVNRDGEWVWDREEIDAAMKEGEA